jgi:hypothetical protein
MRYCGCLRPKHSPLETASKLMKLSTGWHHTLLKNRYKPYLKPNKSAIDGIRIAIINFRFFQKSCSIIARPIRRNSLSGFSMAFPFTPKAQEATTLVVNLAHNSLASNSPVVWAYQCMRTCERTSVKTSKKGEWRTFLHVAVIHDDMKVYAILIYDILKLIRKCPIMVCIYC